MGSPCSSVVKNPPASAGDAGDLGSIPASGRSLGVGSGTHSSIPAWEIPWTEEPGGYSPWGHKESDMTEQLSAHAHMVLEAKVDKITCPQ